MATLVTAIMGGALQYNHSVNRSGAYQKISDVLLKSPSAALIPTQLAGTLPAIVGWQNRIAGDTNNNRLHNAIFGVAIACLSLVFLYMERTSELVLKARKGGTGGAYAKF